MALRNIYTEGDPILRKKCRVVEKFDDRLAMLLDDMHETLGKADGVGLAAPQVGMCKRLFIMHLTDPETEEEISIEAINPEITVEEGKQRVLEGCLSCPDVWGYVTRPEHVVMKAQDRNGEWYEAEFDGLGAQCVCHEYAHLDGQLFVDVVEEYADPDDMQQQPRRKRPFKVKVKNSD